MENRKSFGNMCFAALAVLIAVLLCVLCCPAPKSQASTIDSSRVGSISLTMRATDGKTVSGGQLDLYRVAKVNSSGTGFSYVDAFSSCSTPVTQSLLSNPTSSYTTELVSLSKNAKISSSRTISADGTATFSNLSTGLYLIVQSKTASGYESTNPFLVTIPLKENGSYTYDVNATPKVGVVEARTPENPEEPKQPKQPGNPGTPATSSESSMPDNGERVKARLPQTGQLWWPVWVMGVAGIALVAAGVARKRRSR